MGRLEYIVCGWGMNEECWILGRGTIPGNVKTAEPWERLESVLTREWVRADGAPLRILRCFVDSGYEAKTVYEFTGARYGTGVIAIKGANRYGAELLPNKYSMVNGGTVPMLVIGTQQGKHEVISRITMVTEPGAKYIHFNRQLCDAEFFRQITAEAAVTKTTGNYEYIIYQKVNKNSNNEALDMMVYNYAAMRHLLPNWEPIKRNLYKRRDAMQEPAQPEPAKQTIPIPTRQPVPRRGGFVTNY